MQKDDLDTSSSELNCSSDPSAEDNRELQPKDLKGMCVTQFRKRTQTLPNRKYFVNIPDNGRKQSELFSSDFWSPSSVVQSSSVSSTGSHKRTLSGGLSKLLTLPQVSDSDNFCSPLEASGKQTHHESSLAVATDTSQNGTTVPQPSPELASSPPEEDLNSLKKKIVELKQEMELQRKAYEERISR